MELEVNHKFNNKSFWEKRFFGLNAIHWFLGASFCIWVFCFRGFIFGREYFYSDAQSYQYSIKYFIEFLSRGVYPLWDTTNHNGLPFEFFLRRMGTFNPFYVLIILLQKIGLSYHRAYHLFLAFYYFFGMIGFYGLSKIVLKDQMGAFLAFLFLYFSSWSTRLYDSYILLPFIPMILFFYFLLAFFQEPSKKYFLGATLALMVIFTTYLPFYFLMILLVFLLLMTGFYFSVVKQSFGALVKFIQGDKIFVAICLACFLIALIPGALFYQEGRKGGELILGQRGAEVHATAGGADQTHLIEVGLGTITSWGIEEDLMYSVAFTDMRYFNFAVVYLPVFAICLFLLGLFRKITKKSLFLFCFLMVMMVLFSHRLPVYEYLYERIFFFKFFRNLHFYLWFSILPLFCLLIVEQCKGINLKSLEKGGVLVKGGGLVVNGLIHVSLWVFLHAEGDIILANKIAIVGSALFFTGVILCPRFWRHSFWTPLVLIFLTVVPPVQVYSILADNLPQAYSDEDLSVVEGIGVNPRIHLPTRQNITEDFQLDIRTIPEKSKKGLYYALARYADLVNMIEPKLLDRYLQYPFLAYDRVEYVSREQMSTVDLDQSMGGLKNKAFAHEDLSEARFLLQLVAPSRDHGGHILSADDQDFEIKSFGPNHLTIKTYFDQPKFLVYNDGYHKDWHVWIDGVKNHIYPANVAFKGVFVPAGERTLHYRFGAWWRYALNYGLLLIFYVVFGAFVFLMIREKGSRTCENSLA